MRIILLGAAGFIGTNLVIKLAENKDNSITLVDRDEKYFDAIKSLCLNNVSIRIADFNCQTDFDMILEGQELVYHLVSTTVPTTSNQQISEELTANAVVTARMLDSCVKVGVQKVVFISSGGTVYGKEADCPLKENTPTKPISSYGVQKVTIEMLLYLYHYMFGLDYRVVRLANPYGPYQRPNGVLGVITTFTYKALTGAEILVYGDGTVVRDFIYIDDAIRGILNIVNGNDKHRTFNLGSGYGTSIKDVLEAIKKTLDCEIKVTFREGRKVDVPVNFLDISRYEKAYGKLNPICLEEGIKRTANFMKQNI